jgi:hypothetical protein
MRQNRSRAELIRSFAEYVLRKQLSGPGATKRQDGKGEVGQDERSVNNLWRLS